MAYNGWSNRETWLVNLHYGIETKAELEYIRETLEEQEKSLPPFFRDFVDLSLINWAELESCLESCIDDDEEDK